MDSKNNTNKLLNFKKEEASVAVLMFSFFFLVISKFQLVRPLKKGMFVEYFGADTELYAKLLNILLSAIGVVVFTFLVNRLQRQKVIYAISAFFIGAYVLLSQLLPAEGTQSAAQAAGMNGWAIWAFYLLGDLWSTMMVAGFWAYLTDISRTDQAKRLYGFIGAGGVIGGWIGATLAKGLLTRLGMTNLMLVACALIAGVMIVTHLIEHFIAKGNEFRKDRKPVKTEDAPKYGVALEGARLALRSKYLAAIVGLVFFYEIGSQINDYQFSKYSEGLEGVTNTQAFMSNVSFYANALAVVVQLFIVSFLMRRKSNGVLIALLVLPLALILSAGSFFLMPTLLTASLLFISDNGLNYSIQQTSRESLYVVTSPDEKYKARAFTTMFVQRFAKGVGIFAVMAVGALGFAGASIRYLSIITIAVMTALVFLSLYAGRKFNELSRNETDRDEHEKTPRLKRAI